MGVLGSGSNVFSKIFNSSIHSFLCSSLLSIVISLPNKMRVLTVIDGCSKNIGNMVFWVKYDKLNIPLYILSILLLFISDIVPCGNINTCFGEDAFFKYLSYIINALVISPDELLFTPIKS